MIKTYQVNKIKQNNKRNMQPIMRRKNRREKIKL